jgi:hypothetical protein
VDPPRPRLGSAGTYQVGQLASEAPPEGTVGELLNEYERRVVPTKAWRTRLSNREELKRIRAVFMRMLLRDLKLRHAAQYLEHRVAKVRGNREMRSSRTRSGGE